MNRLSFVTYCLPGLLMCAHASTAAAQVPEPEPVPRIVEIRLSGNEKTRDKVILRELDLAPGDPADPGAIENGRQAVLDLGLFRTVEATTQPVPGGVVLNVDMREKYHLLVVPRVDASSDRDVSYGAQLRWSNVWGLNHRLNLTVESGDFPEERDRREEDDARLSYRAPYLFDTPYELRARLERLERMTPVIDLATNEVTDDTFDETFDQVEIGLARDLRTDRPRSGWIVGGGLFWQRQDTSGDFAPPPDGEALALVGTAEFDDVRFHLYSETGRRFNARVEAAGSGLGSDYSYTRSNVDYFQSKALGETPHQTWEVVGSAGLITGGPNSRNEFSLGGSSRLRGYDSDDLEGNRFYYGSLQYLRPLKWNWLRLLAFVEVGGTDDDREGLRDGSPYADIGVGVRIRLTWFVNVEIEAGWAYPLRGGEGVNFFASGH
ncbi:outer membrane protein assembly factor BamA [Lysobacter niastensis]|uniref:Outer membrane protein assembly factor BamA n=1 Tax=Lysobacter niastensis TaxID=380629 RepID=A0ABU1WEK3_9GAMM|nr:BamA/TamA family outer membrane protein [Lysobacter niastensis]MDR7136031.1 outer membrane protein assembly factor BamA [Lysobacter niastensis]